MKFLNLILIFGVMVVAFFSCKKEEKHVTANGTIMNGSTSKPIVNFAIKAVPYFKGSGGGLEAIIRVIQ